MSDQSTISPAGIGSIAQLTWPDGSYARLAGNSRFVVGTSGAVGTLRRGMAWIRAGKTASSFQVGTHAGAVEATSSSLFIVNCSTTCTASDLSGVLTVGKGSLRKLSTAKITTGVPKAAPLLWDSVFGDAFAKKNASLDSTAGYPKSSQLYAGSSPVLASLTGAFSGLRKLTKASCSGPGSFCDAVVSGNTGSRTYTFAIDCTTGIPCAGKAVTDVAHSAGEPDTHPRVALKFDGDNFTWTLHSAGPYCTVDGQDTGELTVNLTWTAHATAAAVVNGAYVVTKLSGTLQGSEVRSKEAPNPSCAPFVTTYTEQGAFDVARAN